MFRIAPNGPPQGPPAGPPQGPPAMPAGAPAPAAQIDPTQQPPDTGASPVEEPLPDQPAQFKKIDQGIAAYMGPDDGPFECGHCVHFQGPNSCDVVDGQVDEDGCCNLFTPGGQDTDDESAEGDTTKAEAPPDPAEADGSADDNG